MICCHIVYNNEIFLTRDFSKEQYLIPEDDMRYAIETCRNINHFTIRLIRNVKYVS